MSSPWASAWAPFASATPSPWWIRTVEKSAPNACPIPSSSGCCEFEGETGTGSRSVSVCLPGYPPGTPIVGPAELLCTRLLPPGFCANPRLMCGPAGRKPCASTRVRGLRHLGVQVPAFARRSVAGSGDARRHVSAIRIQDRRPARFRSAVELRAQRVGRLDGRRGVAAGGLREIEPGQLADGLGAKREPAIVAGLLLHGTSSVGGLSGSVQEAFSRCTAGRPSAAP